MLVAVAAVAAGSGAAGRDRGERGHPPKGFDRNDRPALTQDAVRSAAPRGPVPRPRSSAAQRSRSRTAYRGRSSKRSLSLLRKRFPQVARLADAGTPQLPRGTKIREHLGDYAMTVTQGKSLRRQVVISSLPLRDRNRRGRTAKVNLGLARVDDDFTPINPIVDATFPRKLTEGIDLGHTGLRIFPVTRPQVTTGTESEDQVFYGNTATDTDVLVSAVPTGVELFTQVRSPEAPEVSAVEFELPEGATLRETADGGAEVVRGEDRVALVMPPLAEDADGRPVPALYRVNGAHLETVVSHRGGSYAYPILVDPLIEDWGNEPAWTDSWFYNPNLDHHGWFFVDLPAGAFLSATEGSAVKSYGVGPGRGLYVSLPPEPALPGDSYGEWLWQAPGQTSYIPQADFGLMYRDTQGGTKNQTALVTGIYSSRTGQFVGKHSFNGRVMGDSTTVRPGDGVATGGDLQAGDIAVFSLASPKQDRRRTWTTAYLGGAAIHLDDPEAPSVNVESSGGWIDPSAGSATVHASDPGLGVHSIRVRGESWEREVDVECGSRFLVCQPELSVRFGYADLGLPDGITAASASATDPLGHRSEEKPFEIKLDSLAPEVTLSGSLADADGTILEDRSYDLHAAAADGSAAQPAAGVKSIEILVDGERQVLRENGCEAGSCALDADLSVDPTALDDGSHTIRVIATDHAGHDSERSVTVRVDRTPPELTLSGTLPDGEDTWLGGPSYTVAAATTDGGAGSGVKSVEIQVDGERADYAEQDCAAGGCSLSREFELLTDGLANGGHEVRIVAQDHAGNQVERTLKPKLDRTQPTFSLSGALKDAEGTELTEDSYALNVNAADGGQADSQSGMKSIEILVDGARVDFVEQPCEDGSCPLWRDFVLQTSDLLPGEHVIAVKVADQLDHVSETAWTVTVPEGGDGVLEPPPVPADASTTLHDAAEFLYTGRSPVQTGVEPATIRPKHQAVLRGKVTTREGTPLAGVQVSVVDHAEYGRTQSQADGQFYMVVNGGAELRLRYEREGYLSADRVVKAPWQDYAWAEDVALVPMDQTATPVDLSSPMAPIQVAESSPVTDDDGTRHETIIFKPGTQAHMEFADGTTSPLADLTVRATEYTVGPNGPDAMPAELPRSSAYTYAVEYTVDEAVEAGATGVAFNQPVVTYVEDFLESKVGSPVPFGRYDFELGAWVREPTGRVVKVLSESGGLAQLDIGGSGQAATAAQLAALGVDEAELREVAQRFDSGEQLWRNPVTHFSPGDKNHARQKDEGKNPGPGSSPNPNPDPDPCGTGGSIIACETQTLGEQVPVTGTQYQLGYSSDRAPGRTANNSFTVRLTGPTIGPDLSGVQLEVNVAGQKFQKSFPAAPNQTYKFTWDGKDVFGRTVQGRQPATVRIGYLYPAVFSATPFFGEPGTGVRINDGTAREEVIAWRDTETAVGVLDARGAGLGGWDLSVHHTYDPVAQLLYKGDGTRRDARDMTRPISRIAGGVGTYGDGVPATQAKLFGPARPAVGSDGSVYVPDFYHDRVRRIAPDGQITTVVGSGDPAWAWTNSGFSGDGGPAASAEIDGPEAVAVGPDGSLYVADRLNHRIRRFSVGGNIETVAGNGVSCGPTDGPAKSTPLCHPSDVEVGPDGTLYVGNWDGLRIVTPDGRMRRAGSTGNSRVYGVGLAPDGSVYLAGDSPYLRLYTPEGETKIVAGTGTYGFSGDGGPAKSAQISTQADVETGPDGAAYITTSNRVRKVVPDGAISTVAGNGSSQSTGDGGPAARASINNPTGVAIASDGAMLITEWGGNRVRRIGSALPEFSGGDISIASTDGTEVYHFNARGQHLDTRNARTGAITHRFRYDSEGRLSEVEDGDGDITRIEHDGSGQPTAIVAPFGQETALETDSEGFLSSIADPKQEETLVDHASDGLLASLTDAEGHTTSFDYDALGRLTKDTDAAGGFKELSRTESDSGYEVKVGTKLGRQTAYGVEHTPAGGRQRYIRTPSGERHDSTRAVDGSVGTVFGHGGSGTQAIAGDPRFGVESPVTDRDEERTPAGVKRELTRTRAATLTSPENPLSHTQLTESSTLNGRTETNVFTKATGRTVTTAASGRVSTTDVDGQGRAVRQQWASLLPVVTTYDEHGRVEQRTQGTRVWRYDYDADGNLAAVTDPLSRTTTYQYDAAGRRIRAHLPGEREVGYGYDATGTLTSITPPGRPAHLFTHTPLHQRETYAAPDAGDGADTARLDYNEDRQLESVETPDGQVTTLHYDAGGQLDRVETPDGTIDSTYTGATGRLHALDTGEQKVEIGYDGTLATSYTQSGAVAGSTSVSYNADFRVASTSVNGSYAAGQTYDGDGLITGSGELAIRRNASSGLVEGTTLRNVATTRTNNAYGEAESTRASFGGGTVFAEAFTRDDRGRIGTETETLASGVTGWTYQYDPAGRLEQVLRDGVPVARYGWDANGNRTYVTRGGVTLTADHDAQDRLRRFGSKEYTYDRNGALRSRTDTAGGTPTTYNHDSFGNLKSATLADGTQLDYVLDGYGRRVATKVGGQLRQGFLYGDAAGPVAELDDSGAVASRFVYAGNRYVPEYMVRGGTTYRFVTDHLGSPRLVVNADTGAIAQELDYDEFGRVLRDTNPGFQPFGFAGGLYDRHTDLARFGDREYDSETGRWTSKDPIGFDGGDSNLYAYVGGDPVNTVDPTGRWGMGSPICGGGGGGPGGGGSGGGSGGGGSGGGSGGGGTGSGSGTGTSTGGGGGTTTGTGTGTGTGGVDPFELFRACMKYKVSDDGHLSACLNCAVSWASAGGRLYGIMTPECIKCGVYTSLSAYSCYKQAYG